MAKPKGRKPAKDSKPPDPKVWKGCKAEGCTKYAPFLEEYCWKHLSDDKKTAYKRKIELWAKTEQHLERANLQEVNLEGADLSRSLLDKAVLRNANLKGAYLRDARLYGALLFGCSLEGAHLERAFMWKADLKDTNLDKAIFSGANLGQAYLSGAIWRDAYDLTWANIQEIGEEVDRDWIEAGDVYRDLKAYFKQKGQYGDESKAYYREKLMAKHNAFWRCFYGQQPPGIFLKKSRPHTKRRSKVNTFFRWLVLWFSWAVMGFGERWWLTAFWAVGFILGFGLLYFWGTNAGWGQLLYKGNQQIKSIWDCLYFSVVTFATLGFGDISPALKSWAKLPVIGEVIMGYVFLGTLVTLIARKMGR
ncbi:hypothetical protein CEE36_04655 [candidate division TA06 bacterium B3_TA06]|uniref:Potassium channel domain-containing protein n=1 Tax=candidate division TA06 bacterium B3_TA06 TaxID=2012487 RepID=A0A532V8L9_UNCT6|nr:MAG: hypothetical protein CEE36_04655 [candidate division TA06 bacterium B3_TA06]